MSADVYKYVFAQLHLLRFGQKPHTLMIDFEMASIVALKALFPTSAIRLCFVHFKRSVYRNVGPLKTLYNENTAFQIKIKLFLALAFLPTSDVGAGFDLIVEKKFANADNDTQTFIAYFLFSEKLYSAV
jgi:undecaprenyl pyrophosphate phosphatase UppP